MSVQVPKGYKQTEVGMIPEDWECQILDELAKRGSGHTPNKKIPEYWNGSIKWISLRDSDVLDKLFIEDTAVKISKKGLDNSSAVLHPAGTVVLSRDAGVGKSAIMKYEMAVSQHFMAWQCNSYLNNKFLYFYLQSKKNEFERIAMGSTIKTIGLPYFKELKIPKPSIEEQQAIAEALSDTDALIESLEQLIAKKRQIKQGAMQELLTGQRRLPGFSGEWIEKAFGELFDFSGGFSASREDLSLEGYCYLHYGDIHGSKRQYIDMLKDFSQIPKIQIDIKRISSKSLLKNGDVVFVDASEDDSGVSKHIVVRNEKDIPFISGLHTIVAKQKTNLLTREYLEYCFSNDIIHNQFIHYAVGTKVTGISKKNIAKIFIKFPPQDEQLAISKILSDIDEDISELLMRLDKARQIKQSMMQELLTGRIRLI